MFFYKYKLRIKSRDNTSIVFSQFLGVSVNRNLQIFERNDFCLLRSGQIDDKKARPKGRAFFVFLKKLTYFIFLPCSNISVYVVMSVTSAGPKN